MTRRQEHAPRGQSGRSVAMGGKDPRARRDGQAERTYRHPLEVDKAGRVGLASTGKVRTLGDDATLEDLVDRVNGLIAALRKSGLLEK